MFDGEMVERWVIRAWILQKRYRARVKIAKLIKKKVKGRLGWKEMIKAIKVKILINQSM